MRRFKMICVVFADFQKQKECILPGGSAHLISLQWTWLILSQHIEPGFTILFSICACRKQQRVLARNYSLGLEKALEIMKAIERGD